MIVLLHSGGADSHVSWLMNPSWKPVYVTHGASNEAAELRALDNLRRLDPRFRPELIKATPVGHLTLPDGHIPFRNLLLLTSALAAHPDAEAVAFGALLGEGSGDKSAAFCRAVVRAWKTSEGRKIRLLRPLRHMTKSMALARGLALPGGHALSATTACYHGTGCGHCQACFRLGIAQYLCGVIAEPPKLPIETLGVRATLAATPVTRWPALAVANIDVVRAYGRYRIRGRLPTTE